MTERTDDGVVVVVLAGGTSRRFGGPQDDKLDAPVGSTSLFATTMASLPPGWPVVAVGPRRDDAMGGPKLGGWKREGEEREGEELGGSGVPASRDVDIEGRAVLWAREDPPFGGPAAALGAAVTMTCSTGAPAPQSAGVSGGREAAGDTLVAVIAGDMPDGGHALPALVAALRAAEPGVDGVQAAGPDGRAQPLLAAYRLGALVKAIDDAGGGNGLSMRVLLAPLALTTLRVGAEAVTDVDTSNDLTRHLAQRRP